MRSRSPIGLDLGSHSFKAVQRNADGSLAAWADMPRRNPGAPIDADDFVRLRGILYRRGFTGSRVVLGAPKSIIQRMTVDLPPLDSGAPIDAIAQSELCRQRGLTPGAFEFRWHESPQPPRGNAGARAITECCTHADANALLDLAESQGFVPLALHSDAEVCASLGSETPGPGPTAVVDLGWTDATFLTVREGRIRFIRSVNAAGLGSLLGAEDWLAESLGGAIRATILGTATPDPDGETADPLDDDDFESFLKRYRATIVREVSSSIDYLAGCAGDEAPRSLVVIGGGSAVPGMRDELAKAAGIAVRGHRTDDTPAGRIAETLASPRAAKAARPAANAAHAGSTIGAASNPPATVSDDPLLHGTGPVEVDTENNSEADTPKEAA